MNSSHLGRERKDQDENTIYERLGLLQHLFESNVEHKVYRPDRNQVQHLYNQCHQLDKKAQTSQARGAQKILLAKRVVIERFMA